MKWFKRKNKIQTPRSIPVRLRARYDAAQTTAERASAWAQCRAFSADAAANSEVRGKLRQERLLANAKLF